MQGQGQRTLVVWNSDFGWLGGNQKRAGGKCRISRRLVRCEMPQEVLHSKKINFDVRVSVWSSALLSTKRHNRPATSSKGWDPESLWMNGCQWVLIKQLTDPWDIICADQLTASSGNMVLDPSLMTVACGPDGRTVRQVYQFEAAHLIHQVTLTTKWLTDRLIGILTSVKC